MADPEGRPPPSVQSFKNKKRLYLVRNMLWNAPSEALDFKNFRGTPLKNVILEADCTNCGVHKLL